MEKTRRLRTWGGFLLLLLLLLIFLIWNILAGSVRLPASEIWTILQGGGELSQRRILLQIRLPRGGFRADEHAAEGRRIARFSQ